MSQVLPVRPAPKIQTTFSVPISGYSEAGAGEPDRYPSFPLSDMKHSFSRMRTGCSLCYLCLPSRQVRHLQDPSSSETCPFSSVI